jgi:hypothetical protein
MLQSVGITSKPSMLQCLARQALYSPWTKPFSRVFVRAVLDLPMSKRRAVSTKISEVVEEPVGCRSPAKSACE